MLSSVASVSYQIFDDELFCRFLLFVASYGALENLVPFANWCLLEYKYIRNVVSVQGVIWFLT